MALIYCPECGTQVSDKAISCTKCAYPIANINQINVGQTRQYTQQYQTSNNSNSVTTNNTIVWILAFAPLIGAILQGFIVGVLFSGYWQDWYNKFWWITLALNILLCHLDEKKLQQDGINTESMGSSWLIPVYLYKRASYLNQSHAYFWVWIIIFVLSLIGIL